MVVLEGDKTIENPKEKNLCLKSNEPIVSLESTHEKNAFDFP